MLNDHLKKLGLKEKEISVYLALAELGKSTVQSISKKSKLPRSSIYGFLETLQAKGLIGKETRRDTSFYYPNEPESFRIFLEQEKDLLKEKEKSTEAIINLISPYLKKTNYSVPKLEFFEGKRAVENMLFQYQHKWRKSYEKLGMYTMWGYQHHSFVEEYGKWHKHAWETRTGKEIIKLFSTEEGVKQQGKDKIKNREIRKLPKGAEFPCSIWIHGEYILFGVASQKPHYVVVLVDTVFSAIMRTMFQLLWGGDFSKSKGILV